jgi:hypothetical protein
MTDASSVFSSPDASLAFSSMHSHLVSSSQSVSGSPGGGGWGGMNGTGIGSGSSSTIGMGIITAGFSTELDALRNAYATQADAVAALQTHYRAALRCEQARVVNVGAFGLLLELPRAAAEREMARQRNGGGGGGETGAHASSSVNSDATAGETNAIASADGATAATARPKRGRKSSAAPASSPADPPNTADASSTLSPSSAPAPAAEPLLEVHDAATKSARRFRTGALARLQQRTHESFAAAHALELALWQRLVEQLVAPRHASRAARVLAAARALAGVDVAAAMAETARLRGYASM